MKLSLVKNATLVLFSIFVIFGFSACSSSQPSMSKVYMDPELDGAPKWIMMPVVEGSISSMGSAKRNAGNDFSFQRQEAMADARDNMARQISIKVNNMFKSFKSATGQNTDATFDKSSESVSKQLASQTLSGTKVHDTWISRSGTLYVLMVIDTKSVEGLIDKQMKTSFKNEKAMYQKFLAAKAQDELSAELEKVQK